MKFFSIVISGILLIPAMSVGQDEPDALTKVRSGYFQKIDEFLEPLQKEYLADLEAFKKRLGIKGDLEAALKVQAEIDRQKVGGGPGDRVDGEKEPPGLINLRAKHLRKIEEAKAPVTRRYVAFLRELTDQLVRKGDIRGAKAVQVELADVLGEPNEPDPYPVPEDKESTIVLWNQNNNGNGDRGTTRANVVLYREDEEVWRDDRVRVRWHEEHARSTEIDVPAVGYDRIRVEITEFIFRGGGLAEIECYVDGQNIAKGKTVKASAVWEGRERFVESQVTDGNTGVTREDGYWLLPNVLKGWIEVDLRDEREDN